MRTTHFPNVQPVAPGSDASVQEASAGPVVFTGNEQHDISLAEAATLTRNFREHADRGAVKGGLVEKGVIEKILAQEGCVGIRLYHGLDARYQRMMVLVGVTGTGKDLKHGSIGTSAASLPMIWDHQNELNSSPEERTSTEAIPRPLVYGEEYFQVTLPEAVEHVHRYQSLASKGSLNALFFGRGIFQKILAQAGCIGIRYYYARKADDSEALVLVGVDDSARDIVAGPFGDYGLPCPPICDWTGIGANW